MASSRREYNATWILSFLLGHFGVDRFYLGYVWLGVAKLLTGGGFGIWYLVDLILVLTGQMKDADGNELTGYQQYKKMSWGIVGGIIGGSIVLGILAFGLMLLAFAFMTPMQRASWT